MFDVDGSDYQQEEKMIQSRRFITHDISRVISEESVVYPGDDKLEVSKLAQIGPECPCNISNLKWTTHFLTHVDPPLHFVKDGKSLDDLELARFFGPAHVIEVGSSVVTAIDIPKLELRGANLLFKTSNSRYSEMDAFKEDHVYISAEAADIVVEAGVNLVAIDYISVDRFGDSDYPAHRKLLGGNVIILEGISLKDVRPGQYYLFALPLKIRHGDGSPVRAILLEERQD